MICKNCKQEKSKDPVIRGSITRFVDSDGRLWNGKICPDCYKTYNRNRMRECRHSKRIEQAVKSKI